MDWKLNSFFAFVICLGLTASGQEPVLQTIATNGWAKNSVNTVVFRKNALTTFKNIQYAAYYDDEQYVVLAKRKLDEEHWEIWRSQYRGDATDAHKSISIMVDGAGFLHLAWGQHNNELNYAKAVTSGSLVMGGKDQMTGIKENRVSYPEFYKMANGNLLFFYRDGGSGNGNLVINRYDIGAKKWTRIQDNLIDGQGERNAYVQTTIDKRGTIHISWVWRESPDVASNHDLCYARSLDGGITWQKSTGENYQLPINAANAEYAVRIPQNSELINQTSMYADEKGKPFIATYWRDRGETVPQYHVVYHTGRQWKIANLGFRTTPFTLTGGGTKKIPISRPQLITWRRENRIHTALIFRDIERGNRVTVAVSNDLENNKWACRDLTRNGVGEWEPSFDSELWSMRRIFALFVQKVIQVDAEGKADQPPTAVKVLIWKP